MIYKIDGESYFMILAAEGVIVMKRFLYIYKIIKWQRRHFNKRHWNRRNDRSTYAHHHEWKNHQYALLYAASWSNRQILFMKSSAGYFNHAINQRLKKKYQQNYIIVEQETCRYRRVKFTDMRHQQLKPSREIAMQMTNWWALIEMYKQPK